MAFGDEYRTAWKNGKGEQVIILEGSGSDGPSFALCFGKHGIPQPFRSHPKSLNAARALTAMQALRNGWHADMKAEIGLFDKYGNELPDPDGEGG